MLDVLTDRRAPVLDDEPAVPIRHGLREFESSLLAGLAADVAALGAGGRVDRVGPPGSPPSCHPSCAGRSSPRRCPAASSSPSGYPFPFSDSVSDLSFSRFASSLSACSSRPIFLRCSTSEGHAARASSGLSCLPRWTRTSCLTLPSSPQG